MHKSSHLEMGSNVDRFLLDLPARSIVVDYGSADFNGSYKDLIEPALKYVGVDLAPGKNVDHVMFSEFTSGLGNSYAAAVISGQCLEHCRKPHLLVEDMFKICRPGGYILLTAPFAFQIHRYPKDYWRFCPDGLEALITSAGGKFIKSYLYDRDCWGIGQSV